MMSGAIPRAASPRTGSHRLGLSAGQLNWRPARGLLVRCGMHRSSEHHERKVLYIHRESYRRSPQSKGWTSVGEPKLGFIERRLLASMDAPYKRSVQDAEDSSHRRLKPSIAMNCLRGGHQSHERLIELSATKATDLDLKRARVTSPASICILRFSLLMGFSGDICAHDRRHLWQAEQICKKIYRLRLIVRQG